MAVESGKLDIHRVVVLVFIPLHSLSVRHLQTTRIFTPFCYCWPEWAAIFWAVAFVGSSLETLRTLATDLDGSPFRLSAGKNFLAAFQHPHL